MWRPCPKRWHCSKRLRLRGDHRERRVARVFSGRHKSPRAPVEGFRTSNSSPASSGPRQLEEARCEKAAAARLSGAGTASSWRATRGERLRRPRKGRRLPRSGAFEIRTARSRADDRRVERGHPARPSILHAALLQRGNSGCGRGERRSGATEDETRCRPSLQAWQTEDREGGKQALWQTNLREQGLTYSGRPAARPARGRALTGCESGVQPPRQLSTDSVRTGEES